MNPYVYNTLIESKFIISKLYLVVNAFLQTAVFSDTNLLPIPILSMLVLVSHVYIWETL